MFDRLPLIALILLAGCSTAALEGTAKTEREASAGHQAGLAKPAGNRTDEKPDTKPAPTKEVADGEKQAATEKKEPAKEDKEAANHESKDEAKDKEKEAPTGHVDVYCVPAQKRSFAVNVDGLGRTEPLPEGIGSLTAAVEGHVHKLLVNLGDSVRAGQPILELDTTLIGTTLAEKLANRDSMKAALQFLESRPRPEELRSAELAVDQAKVGVARAGSLADSLQSLASKHAQDVSPQQLFDAQQAHKQAQLQRDTAEAQLRLLNLGPRPEAVAEGQSKIAMAEQAVSNTRVTLDLHTLRAPISGIVDSLTCHPGQTLTIGTPVGEIVNTRRAFVTVYFPTRSALHIQAGLPAHIDLSSGDNASAGAAKQEELNGRVAFVGNVADPQTGSFPTRILVDNSTGRLRLGQVVKATITVRKENTVIAVPEAAVFDQGEGPLLAVVRDGKIKLLHPELGTSEKGFVAVGKTDLAEGEMVVTEGAYNVPEGTEATVKSAAASVTAQASTPSRTGEHE